MKIAIVAIMLVLAGALTMPQVITEADAKWPIHDYQHEMGQYARLLLIPVAVSIVLLGLWRVRTRLH